MAEPLTPGTASRIPDAETIRGIMDCYMRGQTLDAYRRAERFAPLREWCGVEGCVLAARIADNTGGQILATKLSLRAWRTDRRHPDALAQYGYEVLTHAGPLVLWRRFRTIGEGRDPTPEQQAEILALRARAAADLRDFSTADALLRRAEAMASTKPWIRLQRAHVLECEDRVEEAIAMAGVARDMHPHPFYRPAIQTIAHMLQLLDRDDDAINLLKAADAVLQNGPVSAQLFAILAEQDRWAEAEAALERFVTLSPLLESGGRKWVDAQRCRLAYRQGRRSGAAALASKLDDDYHRKFASRLALPPPDPERVQLDVTFVRQHFKTCAPATMAAIGRYWRMPAEHLTLAEAMCYDGTPSWQQRDWAEKNGWRVIEFRVTFESAVELLGKGVPFAISTVEATSAHMMAVIGFDRATGVLLLRDPGQPYVVRAPVDEFLKRQKAFGPRGTVFIPAGEIGRLEGVSLPDSVLYDWYHKFWLALSKYDRPAAAAALQGMTTAANVAPITWHARLDLAYYDANTAEQARFLDTLLGLFPDNAALLLRKLGTMGEAPREERIKFLHAACAAKDADPALFVALARNLEDDARCYAEAHRWLKRAMTQRPMDSSAISGLADLLWNEGNLDEATDMYRFAANIESFREYLFKSWFIACRRTRRTNEALAHLQDRYERFGSKSEQPAVTLAWAWCELEQPARAREILDKAISLRPDDGYLRLRAADIVAGPGQEGEREKLLDAARGKVREADWLRARAAAAENEFDNHTALKTARELLELEPLAMDAHAGVARAIARLEGLEAALAELRQVRTKYPHHLGVSRMVVDWSRSAGPAAIEAAVREMLALEPSDAWAHRELALALTRQDRRDEAYREAAEGERIDPRNSYTFSVQGHICRHFGQMSEAVAKYRHAVTMSVDNSDAIRGLLELAHTDKERIDVLDFIEKELVRQVVTGDGLLTFIEFATPIVDPETLLKKLQFAHQERPDLWHAWSALVSQLLHMGRTDEALSFATKAVERFPHLPRVWLDLSTVHQWRNNTEAEIEAASRAFESSPAWNTAAMTLAGAFERRGGLDDALRVYERALRHAPRDAQVQASYANLLWRQRREKDAFDAIERALRLAPGYEWAWDLLFEWSTKSGHPERPASFARTLTMESPGEMRVWLMLARVLTGVKDRDERIAAVERAIALDGRSTEAWDLKAELLAVAERFEEALQACADGAAVCTSDTHILRGRQAWIEAKRRKLPDAIRLMQAVLAENASYAWGWAELASWEREQGNLDAATKAQEQLQRLLPHDGSVSRQLGFLRLKQKDQAGAIKAFDAALALAPTDTNAAHNLMDLQLEAGDLKGACSTLNVMQTHQPGASTVAAEIILRLRQGFGVEALKALESLVASPDPDPWPLDAAIAAFQRHDRTDKALKVLKRAIASGKSNPQAGVAMIRALLAKKSNLRAVILFLRMKPGEMQRRAADPLVQGLANARARLLSWVLLVWRRDVLSGDLMAWGQVGFAYCHFNRMRRAAEWLGDWKQRQNVQPWMLFNYCLALRQLGRYGEATEVSRHVVQTWGHREGSADMRLFLAVEAAISGKVSEAEEHLRDVAVRANTPYDQQLLAIAKALVEIRQTPADRRREQFRAVRGKLAVHFTLESTSKAMRDVRNTLGRAADVLLELGAGRRAWWWCKLRLNWQWLLIPAILFFLLLLAVAVFLESDSHQSSGRASGSSSILPFTGALPAIAFWLIWMSRKGK